MADDPDSDPETFDADVSMRETRFDLDLFMAFQPVVDTTTGQIIAQEALVRGPSGRAEASVLARVTEDNRADFDRRCFRAAIETASALGLEESLTINFMPSAVTDAEAFVRGLEWTAEEFGLPLGQIMLEYTEADRAISPGALKDICRQTRRLGVRTILDDFGSGFAGMTRLATLRPAMVKLDRLLVHKIDVDPRRRAIVSGIQAICLDLGIDLVAKGVGKPGMIAAIEDCGVILMQGNAVAAPALEALVRQGDIDPASWRLAA